MAQSTPVFVLGFQRSGTTGLANMLAAHPRVAAVEAGDHGGVHESIFFSHFAKAYGDPASDENFDRFASDFTVCDYYLLTGVDPDWLRAAWNDDRRPRTWADVFRLLMEEVARKKDNASFWLEKSPHHTLCTDAIRIAFPDARFVGIERAAPANIRSWLWMDGAVPPPYPLRILKLLRLSWKWSLFNRTIRKLALHDRQALLVRYEDFAADPETVMRRTCEFLSLEFDPDMLTPRYKRNTSFGVDRPAPGRFEEALDRCFIFLFTALARLVPLGVLRTIQTARERRRGLDWPAWCWKRTNAAHAPDTP